MSRVRCALVTAMVAALLALPAAATATGDQTKGAGKPRQVERLRQIEKKRLRALVRADVAVARPLMAKDFELIDPLGDVMTREDFLGAVRSGALDFLSDTLTSQISVRLHGSIAALRYRHTIDIVVAGFGHLTHPARTTAVYERRGGAWQIVWEQTGAIGPLPQPS
jgi:hypothetical protein